MGANIHPSRIKAGIMTLTGTTSDGSTDIIKFVNCCGNVLGGINTSGNFCVKTISVNNLPNNTGSTNIAYVGSNGGFMCGALPVQITTHSGLTSLNWINSGHIGSVGSVPVFSSSGIAIEACITNNYIPYKSTDGLNNSSIYVSGTSIMVGKTKGTEILSIAGGIDLLGEIYQRNKSTITDIEKVNSSNASTYLTTPTYDGSGQAVHPSVYYNPKKWNGYYYWMAMTPYYNGSSDYENPSILVSQDGINWIVPSGLTNPIEPKPGVGYNLDPCLIEGKDGKLYCFFGTYVAPTFNLYVKSSADGINWSSKTLLKSSTTRVYDSMSVIIENDKYYMWFVDIKVGGKKSLNVMMSSSPTSGWDSAVETTCTLNNIPAGFEIWHPDIRKIGNEYHGFFAVVPSGTTGIGTKMYFANSYDGLTWNIANNPLIDLGQSGAWDSGTIYKGSAVFVDDNINKKYKFWYSATNGPFGSPWYIGYTEVYFGDINQISWTGNTVNGVGTYVNSCKVYSNPNMTFNGSSLSIVGNIKASTHICSPIISGTTCMYSPIICATTCFIGSGVGLTNTATGFTAGNACCMCYNSSIKACAVTDGLCLGSNCLRAYDVIATSDCRLKYDIQPITNALSIVNNLCGVYHKMCIDCNHECKIGLIAQDVKAVLPEIVSIGLPSSEEIVLGINDVVYGLKYDKITAVLIEAIKEQQKEINELKNKINTIKS